MASEFKLIWLPTITDSNGELTYIEELEPIPFAIKRVFYISNVPQDECRGKHAHKITEQLIIAAKGSFNVIMDDGHNKEKFHMDCPHYGLLVPRLVWCELDCFSSDALCLVLASRSFEENDYIRDYSAFMKLIKKS